MRVVGDFRKGDEVPEWLFYMEPKGATSRPGRQIFCVDCSVLETHHAYFIIPTTPSDSHCIVTTDGGYNLKVGATGKRVILPVSFEIYDPVGAPLTS